MIYYQLSGDLSALNLLLLLGLPPLPDLVLQLLSVHGLLLPVRGVPDVVVDRLPDALVALEPVKDSIFKTNLSLFLLNQ